MLNKDSSEKHLKIYELYLQRIMKEYDLIWGRFKIYFGFISGLLVIIGYIIRMYINNDPFNIPNQMLVIIILLSFIGIIFSIAWFFVNRNGRQWMELMNRVIIKVEDYIFVDVECALYHTITGPKAESIRKHDVTIINECLPLVFFIIFLGIVIWSFYLLN